MKAIKKMVAIVLSLAMVIAIAPMTTPVKAGDGIDLDKYITGKNTDGTVDVGGQLKITLNDIEKEVPGFKNRYLYGDAWVMWGISNSIGGSELGEVKASYSSGTMVLDIKPEYANKYLTLFLDDPGYTNYQANSYKVNKAEPEWDKSSQPQITAVRTSNTVLKKRVEIDIDRSYLAWHYNNDSETQYTYDKIITLWRNNKKVAVQKTTGISAQFNNVPVSYGKKDTFIVTLRMVIAGTEYSFDAKTWKDQSYPIGKNRCFATKLAKNKAYVRWNGVTGVSGYYIYKGSKKVKTVSAKKRNATIKGKKAGKSKYKVIPYIKSGKSIYKGSSETAKPFSNQVKYSRNLNVKSYPYQTCRFVITKISLSGKTYKVTGYAINNRIFKCKKYKKLKISLKVDGKKAFSKTFKNKKLNLKAERKKKFVFKIKGKAGRDLAHGTRYLTVGEDPIWDI